MTTLRLSQLHFKSSVLGPELFYLSIRNVLYFGYAAHGKQRAHKVTSCRSCKKSDDET